MILRQWWSTRDWLAANQDKSAGTVCHYMAAWVSYIFCNFYLVKGHLIANDSSTTESRGKKTSTILESVEFLKFFEVCFIKFENNQVLINKISHRFLVTTKLFSG